MSEDRLFPELPLEAWEDTKDTLHLYLQVVGKIRLKYFPKMNHWWHVPFYVSTRGLTTRPIPYRDTKFEMEFDFLDHALVMRVYDKDITRLPLTDGLSVSDFYHAVLRMLNAFGIEAHIRAVPYDVPAISGTPFAQDTEHASYDREWVARYFTVLSRVESVFQDYRGRFIGKSTPPHVFWHHFDLAVTRFSGRTAPVREGAGVVEREAYSHEVISVGFWAGDKDVREPAFYGYSYPVPDGLYDQPLRPGKAFWNAQAGMALYRYADMRSEDNPREALLAFLESVYTAGAQLAGWDMESFKLT